MKRLLALTLILLLAAATLAGCGGSTAADTLIVGSGTLTGNFIHGFGTNTYDGWVKTILHEHYSTYVVTDTGEVILNTIVVKDLGISVDAVGNKTYTFEIHEDLKWSNGNPITARDYVFTVLWCASREWEDAGASSAMGNGLLGYTEYHEGNCEHFAGVKLLEDHKFSLTIDASELPYFYETTYVAVYPTYKHGWSYFSEIDSCAGGAKLTSDCSDWTLAFDTMRVAQTERYAPTVTSGPFTYVNFVNDAVTLKANPHFKGDYKGQKPQLDYIIIRSTNPTLDVDLCIEGEVDAITGIVEGAKIETAKAAEEVKAAYYPRNGFSGIFFHCDFGPAQHAEVRQAIAYLMDRQEIIDNILGGHGTPVNGLYGLAQWMYLENKGEIDSLPNFVLDVAKANEILDNSPYRFEADGSTPFDPGKAAAEGGCFRHNAKGEMLTINHLETEDGGMLVSPLAAQLKANAPLAGIDFQVAHTDFSTLLDHWYEGRLKPEEERKYHSFFLATSITAEFDPYFQYHTEMMDKPYYNSGHVSDSQLDEIMVRLRRLNPEQRDEFSAEWVKFQKRWNELLPIVPLYSNHYYDIYRLETEGFRNSPFVSWANLVCEIKK